MKLFTKTAILITMSMFVMFSGCGKKAEVRKISKRIVFFGDSITFGYGVDTQKESFYSRIDNIMKAGVYDNAVAINAGVNGDNTYSALERINDVVACKPDILIVAFGLNDCQTDSVDPEQFRKNLIKMISFFPRDIRIVLATSNSFMDTGQDTWRNLNGSLDLYMAEIRNLARERSYPLIDVHDIWKNQLRQDSRNLESMYVDPTHPSAKGHELIYETYMSVLRKLIVEK
ncbi:MAG: SGNH/GDSL hydrolase family protein [Candidatus Latescibacteria bacterium]|nr:SGNH/GDSL hydrolase family protein [Candidatus Latescibacterota bacterium]